MKYLVLMFAFVHFSLVGLAQSAFLEQEKELEKTATALMMADDIGERKASFEDLQTQLVTMLTLDSSFYHPFNQLKRISLIQAPDSSFRLFTGQLYLNENEYQYYGILQTRDQPQSPIVLTDRSEDVFELEQDILTKDDWYGAVYYNIKSFTKEGKTLYALFGFDTYRMFENRKVVEVLHFDGQKPIFGSSVFTDDYGLTKNRLVVQYASDVSIKLNYDQDLQLIVFDHLIPMKSPYKGQKISFVPDGSYRGYQLNQSGTWTYIDKIFHTTLAEPPRERPVLDKESGRDIFGKKKNR